MESGLRMSAETSSALLVPFVAHKLRRASVAWVNQRWFLERGLDVCNEDVLSRVRGWLLAEFAFCAPRTEDATADYTGEQKTFHADRYGTSGIAPHGGSGRVGISGCFQAKGIGVTPLVGAGTPWSHSHGCMWLEEAIREAIYAEITAAEFPHGSVPIIAILDTGLRYVDSAGKWEQRRAIAVRPFVLRPAHLERATGFQPTPPSDRAHLADVERVRSLVCSVIDPKRNPGAHQDWLTSLFCRLAEQAAFGQVHRLFLGSYFSSNVSWDGALLDFGGFRALPDWSKAFAASHIPGFGDEIDVLWSAIRSLTFFCNKYQPATAPAVSETEILGATVKRLRSTFERECLRIWNLDEQCPATLRCTVIQALEEHFELMQERQVRYQRTPLASPEWLHEALLSAASGGNVESNWARAIHRIHSALHEHFCDPAGEPMIRLSFATALRLVKPRTCLYREELQDFIQQRLGGADSSIPPDPTMVARIIDSRIAIGRRHWPLLPANLAVLSQVSYGGASALLCRDLRTRQKCLWLEGIRSGERVTMFGRSAPVQALQSLTHHCSEVRWAGRFPISADEQFDEHDQCLVIAGLTIPAMELSYEYPEWIRA